MIMNFLINVIVYRKEDSKIENELLEALKTIPVFVFDLSGHPVSNIHFHQRLTNLKLNFHQTLYEWISVRYIEEKCEFLSKIW